MFIAVATESAHVAAISTWNGVDFIDFIFQHHELCCFCAHIQILSEIRSTELAFLLF